MLTMKAAARAQPTTIVPTRRASAAPWAFQHWLMDRLADLAWAQ